MTPPTPGQVCYETWCAMDTSPHVRRWTQLRREEQHAWEAAAQAVLALVLPTPERPAVTAAVVAAQAVLAQAAPGDTALDRVQGRLCPVCGAHDPGSSPGQALASRPPGLTADGEVHRDMTCEDCGATWVNVYTFAEARYVQAKEEDLP